MDKLPNFSSTKEDLNFAWNLKNIRAPSLQMFKIKLRTAFECATYTFQFFA